MSLPDTESPPAILSPPTQVIRVGASPMWDARVVDLSNANTFFFEDGSVRTPQNLDVQILQMDWRIQGTHEAVDAALFDGSWWWDLSQTALAIAPAWCVSPTPTQQAFINAGNRSLTDSTQFRGVSVFAPPVEIPRHTPFRIRFYVRNPRPGLTAKIGVLLHVKYRNVL